MEKRLVLSGIWIYPIKSLGGVRLNVSTVLGKGLEHDRRFMLVDGEGKAMTQRERPKLCLFKPSISGNTLTVSHVGSSIEIPLMPEVTSQPFTALVWDDKVSVYEVDGKISQWFSQQLGEPCTLVYFPEKHPRPVDQTFQINQEHVSLADAFPILAIGEASLADLNSRMPFPLPMNRFRPNIVISGGTPFEEDDWYEFSVGGNTFAAVKPCSRCVLTTVDQETGEKGSEPLKTLATYRKQNNKIYFGQNVLPLVSSSIQIGDIVKVINHKNSN